ncbi:sulfite exporter TauE/SafE family protein [Corallincola holothuriorum]|uniref:Probable membrane transporter protein n=1 Tax=Corallincola holothuriorum TaxID=2282215 RepID=A0A368NJL8_9GAMM|nr:sulfite exporter TauE/SafE family protein [Corallincola holothuriorum]RCU50300.1 sulfite exporter TauE/SafE family protein [Corallincola holothuriorum]
MLEQITLLIVSLIANTFSAFSGGGAGLLQFPLLIFLGLPFAVALATHKIASVALGVGALVRHAKERTLTLRLSLEMLLFGVPGVLFGARTILSVPEQMAQTALGCLTIGLGLYSATKKQLGVTQVLRATGLRTSAIGGLGLFVIGVLNGSLTSGTGLFVTLWLVLWYGLDYKRAVAFTLVWVGVVWNGSGAAVLGVLGEVQWSWLPPLLLGSLLGGYLGAHLAIAKGSRWIKRAFEVVTIAAGLALLAKVYL